jgi:hypothetical protein
MQSARLTTLCLKSPGRLRDPGHRRAHEEFDVETDWAGELPMPFWSETVRRVVMVWPCSFADHISAEIESAINSSATHQAVLPSGDRRMYESWSNRPSR